MKTIIANWKMNVGVRESVALARGTLLTLRGRKIAPELIICPAFIALSEVRKVVARSSVALGAQNVFWEESGAHTGEISTRMLQELNVSHVLLGHSERRAMGETDEDVHKKLLRCLEDGIAPIVCVGETKDERDQGQAMEVVKRQITSAFQGVQIRSQKVFVAYEPVWAIGTGDSANVSDVMEMHTFIRSVLNDLYGDTDSKQLPIIYGGSVDPENAYGFLREIVVDGLLVGGASVKINQFKDIVSAAVNVMEAQQ